MKSRLVCSLINLIAISSSIGILIVKSSTNRKIVKIIRPPSERDQEIQAIANLVTNVEVTSHEDFGQTAPKF